MAKENKTIEKEIEEKIEEKFGWLFDNPIWFGNSLGEINRLNIIMVKNDFKLFISRIIKQILQRFVEETKPYRAGEVVRVDDVREGDGVKKCLEKLDQKQAKWLKEKLSQ